MLREQHIASKCETVSPTLEYNISYMAVSAFIIVSLENKEKKGASGRTTIREKQSIYYTEWLFASLNALY